MTIDTCQARYGWSAEKCQLIKEKCRPKGDPHECTVEYCGDGIVQTGEDCDPQQSVSDCVQNTQKRPRNVQKLIGSCGRDCKLVEIPNDVVVDDTVDDDIPYVEDRCLDLDVPGAHTPDCPKCMMVWKVIRL